MADRYPCPLGRPCGTHGSAETYAAQVTLRLNGKDRGIDPCVAPIVQALYDAGLKPVASCCGHGVMPASVLLEDGREVLVVSRSEADRIAGTAREESDPSFRQSLKDDLRLQAESTERERERFAKLYATLPVCSDDDCAHKATRVDTLTELVFCDDYESGLAHDLPWAHIVREQEGRK